MGVFTDYTRHVRAMDFVEQYSEKIYFGFGFGDPDWSPEDQPLLAPSDLNQFLEDNDPEDPGYKYGIYTGSTTPLSSSQLEISFSTGCPPFFIWNKEYEPVGQTEIEDTSFFNDRIGKQAPLGMLALVKAKLHFVEDVTENPGDDYTFSYGGRLWRYLDENQASQSMCNSVLVEATVRAGQIVPTIEEDGILKIRQVSVMAFNNSSGLCSFMIPASSNDAGSSTEGDSTAYKEFSLTNVKSAEDTGEIGHPIGLKDVHVMINDYLVSSSRMANQQDRYGYVIGF